MVGYCKIMSKSKIQHGPPEYDTVLVADLRISRKGKHHDLVMGILQGLNDLPEGSALVIPLDQVGEISVAGLRSAVTRVTATRQIPIVTYSDNNNFYVWKKSPDSFDSKEPPK